MFKQAKQNRAFEDVIFQIQEAILQRSLKVGDKLPSERQLRETFKVSRGTLREALRALEQKGLITIKTGVQGGAFICPVNNKMMSESLDLLLRQQKITLKELAEFREAVDAYSADSGHPFRSMAATHSDPWRPPRSERSDAGILRYFTDSLPFVKFLFSSHGTSFQ